jgi:murein endopeptidase
MPDGVPIQPRDSRGYFMLPQAPEEAGYYVYGNVGGVARTGDLAQYAHPFLLSLIFEIEREWQAIEDRKFGIGNISLAGGRKYEHATHQLGIEMDIRPVRKDMMTGQAARGSRFDKVYDREATIKLLRLFLGHSMVSKIFFNDGKVQQALGGRVRSWAGHDDHIHIEIWKWSIWT